MAKNLINNLISNTKTRTMVLLLGALVIISILFIFFRSSSEVDILEEKTSRTAAVPSSIKAVPGNETPEKYRELQIEENRQRVLEAYQKRTSAIPTIVGSVATSELNNQEEDPLEEEASSGITNLLGNAQRGGFIGRGSLSRRAEVESASKNREEKIEREKERVKQLREDRQKQKDLDRARKIAAEEQARYADSIKQTAKAMQKHAGSMFPTWTTFTPQSFTQGALAQEEFKKDKDIQQARADGNTQPGLGPDGKPLKTEIIKAGSVLFAVVETAINTDEPSPVMATVVSGKYKGAKLLGDVQHSSRQEKLVLSFNVMSLPKHATSTKVSAVAIDPDTARTALASDVDHHYLLRYGTLFASAFMDGYGDAISDQGTTSITSPTGTVTTVTSNLSGSEEFYSALGEVGKQWAKQTSKIFDRPYTVTVDQGVGIGVLFLNDANVTNPDAAANTENNSAGTVATTAAANNN